MLDLVIVGGGPAGIAAGIQARHMGLHIKILEKAAWGGRLSLARKVENFPGLACAMSGIQVVEALMTQARSKGLPLVQDTVESIDVRNGSFIVHGRTEAYETRTVIVASGVEPKKLSIPGMSDRHERLFYTWRELPTVQGTRVAVIGGGEAAFDQACSLADRGAYVVVVVRGHAARAFHGLVQEAQQLGVRVILDSTVTRADRAAGGLALRLTGESERPLLVDYVLASIGVAPSEIGITDKAVTRADRGLYRAGDLCLQDYRQAAIAFGDGIKKAMMAYEHIKR